MRFYNEWGEAVNEIRRDLKELGILVHPQTMQDKFIGGDPDYNTHEITDYSYRILNPMDWSGLNPTQPWADAEFEERVSGKALNPGEAWQHRRNVWAEFLNDSGRFAYTYSERFQNQLEAIIDQLKSNPESRQLYLAVWDTFLDTPRLGGIARVPCTLGYQFRLRQGKLDMTYLMRSCDFATHFQNDAYLAARLLHYVAFNAHIPQVGYLSHWIGSLHIYAKDVAGVF